MKLERLAISLMVAMVVLTFVNVQSKPVDSGVPAIVNPTGWDKPTIIKHLDDIIAVCKKTPTWANMVNKLNAKVCDLPYPIWGKLDEYLWTFKDQDPSDVANLVITTCNNFKLVLK